MMMTQTMETPAAVVTSLHFPVHFLQKFLGARRQLPTARDRCWTVRQLYLSIDIAAG